MEQKKIYISLEQSILVPHRKITIGDIATIFCVDNDIKYEVSKMETKGGGLCV